ncbi:MAG: glycosyltransferase [Phycisphaerae bacterium]|nr:glycosyltransferase [Phycisphaerae bacterium]
MLRILHVVQSLDPAWGGIARVLPELAAGLTQHGVRSIVATLAGGRYGTPADVPDVDVQAFSASDGRLGRSAGFARAIKSVVGEADVVHLHGLWTFQNWKAAAAARHKGKPYVVTPHSMMMPWAWQRSRLRKRVAGWLFEHRNLRQAACLHALADGEAEEMRRLGFNSRIEIIPNGLWPQQYASLPPADDLIAAHPRLADRRWMLFLSRIHPQKGIVPLMQACLDEARSAAKWQLVVAGPDEIGLRRVLEAAVARKGLSDRVTFLGMLDRRQVLAALGRASAFLQPSFSEGLSMSILEAAAAGVPLLISPACNLPEVAARGAGLIVDPDRRSIASGLRRLLELDEPRRAAMGEAARALVRERFSWEALLPRYAAWYTSIARRRG